jgi:hypothetical protein
MERVRKDLITLVPKTLPYAMYRLLKSGFSIISGSWIKGFPAISEDPPVTGDAGVFV